MQHHGRQPAGGEAEGRPGKGREALTPDNGVWSAVEILRGSAAKCWSSAGCAQPVQPVQHPVLGSCIGDAWPTLIDGKTANPIDVSLTPVILCSHVSLFTAHINGQIAASLLDRQPPTVHNSGEALPAGLQYTHEQIITTYVLVFCSSRVCACMHGYMAVGVHKCGVQISSYRTAPHLPELCAICCEYD